ncbi:MAG: hypothetical protein K2G29_05265 [Muribaculaceae bacterium]|nr:hypothetical protein [Muribaculaceae bacterium]
MAKDLDELNFFINFAELSSKTCDGKSVASQPPVAAGWLPKAIWPEQKTYFE